MRKTSLRELHIHTSELVPGAAEGGVIRIERRGKPVVELRPIAAPYRMPAARKAQIFDSMRELWERLPLLSDSASMIEVDRDRKQE